MCLRTSSLTSLHPLSSVNSRQSLFFLTFLINLNRSMCVFAYVFTDPLAAPPAAACEIRGSLSPHFDNIHDPWRWRLQEVTTWGIVMKVLVVVTLVCVGPSAQTVDLKAARPDYAIYIYFFFFRFSFIRCFFCNIYPSSLRLVHPHSYHTHKKKNK